MNGGQVVGKAIGVRCCGRTFAEVGRAVQHELRHLPVKIESTRRAGQPERAALLEAEYAAAIDEAECADCGGQLGFAGEGGCTCGRCGR